MFMGTTRLVNISPALYSAISCWIGRTADTHIYIGHGTKMEVPCPSQCSHYQ